MPSKSRSYCACHGCRQCGGRCPNLVQGGKCDDCRSQHPKPTRSEASKERKQSIYDSPRWQGIRRTVLAATPWCGWIVDASTGRTCGALATDVDHIVAVADDGDRWSLDNLQALCRRHHSMKTASEQRARRQVDE